VSGLEAEMRIRLFMFELFGTTRIRQRDNRKQCRFPQASGNASRWLQGICITSAFTRVRATLRGSVSWRYVSKMYGDSDNSDTVSGAYTDPTTR
jgi:hypothetical protein